LYSKCQVSNQVNECSSSVVLWVPRNTSLMIIESNSSLIGSFSLWGYVSKSWSLTLDLWLGDSSWSDSGILFPRAQSLGSRDSSSPNIPPNRVETHLSLVPVYTSWYWRVFLYLKSLYKKIFAFLVYCF
jgi:hypothetical protein